MDLLPLHIYIYMLREISMPVEYRNSPAKPENINSLRAAVKIQCRPSSIGILRASGEYRCWPTFGVANPNTTQWSTEWPLLCSVYMQKIVLTYAICLSYCIRSYYDYQFLSTHDRTTVSVNFFWIFFIQLQSFSVKSFSVISFWL